VTDDSRRIKRRDLLKTATLGSSGLLLAGCDAMNENATFRSALRAAESLNYATQRSLTDRAALAPEFSPSDISLFFKTNGSITGNSVEYLQHVAENFANWKLRVDGLVANPLDVGLDALKAMPARSQITRHDCVEGWSAIAHWRGTPLRYLLQQAQLSLRAKYIVFHCADSYGAVPYYESIDLVDVFSPANHIGVGHERRCSPGKTMARRCDCAWNASLGISTQNISCASRRRMTCPNIMAVRADIGKMSATMNGMLESRLARARR